jgi:hypothetical protein
MIIKQVDLVLGTIKGHMMTAGMSTRAVARELNINFFNISKLLLDYLAVSPTGLTRADQVYGIVWASGLLSTVPNGGGGVMVWAGAINERTVPVNIQ